MKKLQKSIVKSLLLCTPKDYGKLIAQSWLECWKRKIIMPELQEVAR